jgi:phosphoribosylaminoimidazole-succinocarboxamide synthase
LFLFAVIVISVDARSVDDSSHINCYIKHLKNANELDVNYPEITGDYKHVNCSELIKNNNNKLYQQIATNALSGSIFNDFSQCLIEELKTSNAANHYMKRLVYSNSNWTSELKQQKDKEVKNNIKVILRKVVKSCKVCEVLNGKQFDSYFKIFSEGSKDPVKEFCVRKHVLENKLIDTSTYNVTLEPNTNATELICAKKLESFAERFTKELITVLKDNGRGFTDAEVECFLARLQNVKFMDKMLVIGVLSEISITEAQKADERRKYVEFMGKAAPYECVL